MAMTYQNFASLGVNLNRQKNGPLDISNVFTSAADLKYYLTEGAFTEGVSSYWYESESKKVVPYPYEGQVLATVIDGVVNVYTLALDAEGKFVTQEIAGKIEVDGTTIVKDAEGKLSIVAPVNPDSSKTYNFAYANGVYSWVEVDTATAAGQAQAIAGLTDRAVALETAVNGKAAVGEEGTEGYVPAVVGLVDKVAALEAVDNATQAELDAYKEVVTAAIAAGVKEAKDYADQNDADTKYDDSGIIGRIEVIEGDYLKTADKYDDTALAARVKAIEDDYLKDADKYDDTAIAGRVEDLETAVEALETAVEAIDFVDSGELATALEPYATSEYVDTELEAGLELKADKDAFEELRETVEAFLTGDGTEAALDSLKELIAYIDEHDGADLTEMIATIEGIEGKLEGIDTTVAAYVTAAIDALKIGDYAKASELTDLAGRVEALEGKPFDTYATKTEVSDVNAKFADYTTTAELTELLADKADADSVVANDTFTAFQEANTGAIATAKSEAISEAAKAVEEAGFAVATEVEATYATKNELTEAVEGIENDLVAYAKTTDVEAELAKKADASAVYTKTEIDNKIGAPGTPAVKDEEGNVTTEAVAGTGVYQHVYSKDEVTALIADITGGESAADVLAALNAYKTTNDTRVKGVEDVNASQATAIEEAKAQADKGVADAKQVSEDLAALDARVVSNANEIASAKSTISTVHETLGNKITALETAKGEQATQISGIDGRLTTAEANINTNSTDINTIKGQITALGNEDTRLAGLIDGLSTSKANAADVYTKGEADAAIGAAIDAKLVDVNAAIADKADTSVVNAALDLKANAADVYAKADVYTKDEANAEFMTQTEVDDRINALIVAADPDGGKTISDIQNLVKYVDENAGEIAALVTASEANTNKLAGIDGTVTGYVATEIAKLIQPKASTEITVADDGTLGIGQVSTDKLVQGLDTLVLVGGSAKA